MPGGRQRTGFRFAVSDHNAHDQIGIVECRAERVRHAVAQLAAFVDRSRNLRRAVAPELAGKRKSPEELEHSRFVLALLRIDLRVRAFQIAVRDHGGRAMSWARK